MDRTFVMVKPDGVQRGLVGEIVSRLETKGLKKPSHWTHACLVPMARIS